MQVLKGNQWIWDFNFNLDERSKSRIVKNDSYDEIFYKTDHDWIARLLNEKLGPDWKKMLDGDDLKGKLIVELTQFDGSTQKQVNANPLRNFYYKY